MSERQGDFGRFYAAFPRKKKPRDAEKAWRQTEKDRPPIDELLSRLEILCVHEYRRRDPNMIPYPATWLRAHEWEDADQYTKPLVERAKEVVQPIEHFLYIVKRSAQEAGIEVPGRVLQATGIPFFLTEFRSAFGADFFTVLESEKGMTGFFKETRPRLHTPPDRSDRP